MAPEGHELPFRTFGPWLKERFGFPVRKVSVNAAFTCPNRDGSKGTGGCIFCDNQAFTPALEGSLSEQINLQLERMREKPEGILVYFQPFSNTYAPVGKLRSLWQQALSHPKSVGIAVGTRPDCLPDEVLQLADTFARRTMFWLEVGVQTAKDETLDYINRHHGWKESAEALRAIRQYPKILLCVHLIIGLPGEDREDVRRSAELVARFRPAGVKLHHLHVIRGTRLHELYERGLVEVLETTEYASLAADVIERLPPETVLQRLSGEVRGDLLVAPEWAETKHDIRRMIAGELHRRGTRQGSLFPG